MKGLAILLSFNFLGLGIEKLLHIPIPGNVIGLILFGTALFCKVIKLEWVEQTAEFLLKHMMLLFAPVVVGTIAFFPLIGENVPVIVISLVGSTFITLLVTGWVTNSLLKKEIPLIPPEIPSGQGDHVR